MNDADGYWRALPRYGRPSARTKAMASRVLRLSDRADVAGHVRAEASHRRLDSSHRPTAGDQHSLSEAALAHPLLRFGFYLHWTFHDSNRAIKRFCSC